MDCHPHRSQQLLPAVCQGVLWGLPIHSLICTHSEQAGRPPAVHILQAGDPRPERLRDTSQAHGDCVRELEQFIPITYLPAKGSFHQSTLPADSESTIRMCVRSAHVSASKRVPVSLHLCNVPHTPSVTSNMPIHRRRVNPLFTWAPTALCGFSWCCCCFPPCTDCVLRTGHPGTRYWL